ncbi:ribonuclease HII [Ehrlichia ruminantium]|uniref:Ribonuclease HII n=2 Tax=Ehrlichia ruminantium TaxID=779 RepID=RNH2_EHRRG|nr:RecName: Full=Ribonuclease HII; Short=RNase HII [Ehrlichia ruminantium str. Gardel]QLK50252.1 ribonuclease HII [Ehrlichia ruminantium]CAI26669.1 Ribonuclease HII [Ehrlichia ruminantium str. Welgevonden]QLK51177.1 ribonuclease HII [Ehrlichia ruminantium]QLK53011.1 ribonuclease HII [Ehrlichia ruminantium]QLK54849.1 ribonuclease HII [Ehrlichia ruminantium]
MHNYLDNIMPDFSIENEILKLKNNKECIIVGVDEVGYGSLAGPVVSAAVFFPNYNNETTQDINDSKKLTPKTRQKIYNKIITRVKWSIGFAHIFEIDEYNILNATHIAMKRALTGLNAHIDIDYVIIDGNKIPNIPWNAQAIIGGDTISTSIAAASIIAKVTRDRLMETLHIQYPQYNWNKNKGYGTKDHITSLYKYGKTIHHRNTFTPISKISYMFKNS